MKLMAALLLFLALEGRAQSIGAEEFRKVFNAVSKGYSTESYQLGFEHEIFLKPGDTQPFYTSRGRFLRGKGRQYRTESPGQLTIQDEKIKMVIDSANRLVLLFKPDTLYSPMLLSHMDQSPVWRKASYRSDRQGELERYTVFFNERYEYESIEYLVNPKTNRLQELVMHLQPGDYYNDQKEEESQSESPRIVIRYGTPSGKLTGKEFQTQPFLSEKDGKYVLTDYMKGFVLDDLRYQ